MLYRAISLLFTPSGRGSLRHGMHKPILQMFIICSYMSESKTGQPGPSQPPVDRPAASRRNRPRIGASRSIYPFCAFLRFLAFLRICLSAVSAIRNGLAGSSHHELNGIVQPATNNSIRRVAECTKLLHTQSAKICSN